MAAEREEADSTLPVWPVCPDCSRLRTAVCAWCGTAGTQFPLADNPPGIAGGEDSSPGLWLCPTCDEVLEDRFLRRCEWCGHDFGAGLELPAPRPQPRAISINRRAMTIVLGLAGLLALVFLYFAVILSR